jgi:hypothetical protein
MASIERTAYPRFKRFMSARELHVFYTPQPDEIVWAREAASSDEHLLALVTQLKAFNRLGYFPVLNEVPAEVVGHIRRDLRLPEGTMPICASTRTAERHRNLVRARGEVVYDPAGARKVAADAIEEAARRKNDPADLINIALERLVEGSYELPATCAASTYRRSTTHFKYRCPLRGRRSRRSRSCAARRAGRCSRSTRPPPASRCR